jgi:hypothetical protein
MTKFKKTSYSSEVLPDAEPGKYMAQITKVEVTATKKTQEPMTVYHVKTTSCEDDQDEKNLGATLRVYITHLAGSRGNMGKLELKALLESIEEEWDDIVPSEIESASDFDGLVSAAKGKTVPIWVSVDTEMRANASFRPPREKAGSLGATTSDDEDEDKPKAKKAAASKRR